MDRSVRVNGAVGGRHRFSLRTGLGLLSLCGGGGCLGGVGRGFGGAQAATGGARGGGGPGLRGRVILDPSDTAIIRRKVFAGGIRVATEEASKHICGIGFGPVGFTRIGVLGRSAIHLGLAVVPKPTPARSFLCGTIRRDTHFLVVIHHFGVRFAGSTNVVLPNFHPRVNSVFNRKHSSFKLSPKVNFTFNSIHHDCVSRTCRGN